MSFQVNAIISIINNITFCMSVNNIVMTGNELVSVVEYYSYVGDDGGCY